MSDPTVYNTSIPNCAITTKEVMIKVPNLQITRFYLEISYFCELKLRKNLKIFLEIFSFLNAQSEYVLVRLQHLVNKELNRVL